MSICNRCNCDAKGALFHRTPAMCAEALKEARREADKKHREDVRVLLTRISDLEKENAALKTPTTPAKKS